MLLIVLSAALGACATLPEREDVSSAARMGGQLVDFTGTRFDTEASIEIIRPWHDRWMAERRASGDDEPIDLLAISSGSDKGAFSAGFLTGWSKRGDRPDFDLVIGVSTGALIAPFAFLGPSEDDALRRLYTTIDADDIYRQRAISGLLGGPAFATSRPLLEMIEREVSPELVERIAEEHRKGRRLLVTTTNLDTQRGTIWDLGSIAVSPMPNREHLIESLLLASSSVPALMPPVMIDVEADGQPFREMHVDGGTAGSFLAIPPSILWGQAELRERADVTNGSFTILYNGRLAPQVEGVEPTAFSILRRSIETMIAHADRNILRSYRDFAVHHGVTLAVYQIGDDFDDDAFPDEQFDSAFMQALFAHGEEQGRQ